MAKYQPPLLGALGGTCRRRTPGTHRCSAHAGHKHVPECTWRGQQAHLLLLFLKVAAVHARESGRERVRLPGARGCQVPSRRAGHGAFCFCWPSGGLRPVYVQNSVAGSPKRAPRTATPVSCSVSRRAASRKNLQGCRKRNTAHLAETRLRGHHPLSHAADLAPNALFH